MITIKNISRYKAASIHLAISAGIAVLVLSVMLALWYPLELFRGMGGAQLIMLIVGVDVIIGPLITLIIFNTSKKELVFDLAVVAALQIAALCYGVYAMHAGRPVFTVFTDHQLVVVTAAEIDPEELAKARIEEFRSLSQTGPKLVATEPPTDPGELSNIAFAGLAGLGIQHLPRYYVPYAGKREQILKASRPLTDLKPTPHDSKKLESYVQRSNRKLEELRCLPVQTKLALLTAIVDAHSGELLDILDIRPDITPR